MRLGSLAAGLLLAFTLGRSTRPEPRRPEEPKVSQAVVPKLARPEPATPVQSALARPDPAVAPEPLASLTDALKSQIERRGYEIGQRRRMVAARLKDGRRVLLPVQETEFRFVGHRTF